MTSVGQLQKIKSGNCHILGDNSFLLQENLPFLSRPAHKYDALLVAMGSPEFVTELKPPAFQFNSIKQRRSHERLLKALRKIKHENISDAHRKPINNSLSSFFFNF